MKVLNDFFCIEEKKAYKKGDEYKGKRTDIDHLLEVPKKVNEIKVKDHKIIKSKKNR